MPKTVKSEESTALQLTACGVNAFDAIAQSFPICSSSDEFYFFPQVEMKLPMDSGWDDFSDHGIQQFSEKILCCETELKALQGRELPQNLQIDLDLLSRTLATLREELLWVAPQSSQPSFHLTVVAVGLGQALTKADKRVWDHRVSGLPAFLERAANCLTAVPAAFLKIGQDMLVDLETWLADLNSAGYSIEEIKPVLRQFGRVLEQVKPINGFRLPEEILNKLVNTHLGCGSDIDAVERVLKEEFREMEDLLSRESALLRPGRHWTEVCQEVPFCPAPEGDLLELYRRELIHLEAHCLQRGFVPESLHSEGLLALQAVPDYFRAIRASDAYSATPGHPPHGGTFFVMQNKDHRPKLVGRSLEYRLTAIHEAWPGHHLLDCSRWNSDNLLRRPIELPLFYEGWACLAEELMAATGYLIGRWDRFLLAKRRIERAARGLADLGLQTGRMDFLQAVQLLMRVGYPESSAEAVLPKYLLRPGYQVCYTFGLIQGLELYRQFGRQDSGSFARTVLEQGEIGFNRLEWVLREV